MRSLALALALVLVGCGPLDSWNPPVTEHVAAGHCASWQPDERGPDDTGLYCQPRRYDPNNADIGVTGVELQ